MGKTPRAEWRARGWRDCFVCCPGSPFPPSSQYAYLIGQYLGDGSIASFGRGVFALRISSFSGYPGIIDKCVSAMKAVMPANKATVTPVPNVRVVIITSYSKHWPCLFPQHGPGRKHERKIKLLDWQLEITQAHPEELLRGLIHLDGCRDANNVGGKSYPRYSFSNMSLDIQRVFTDACDLLGIHWTQPYFKTISIARRESVAKMDTFIGPKH